MAFSSHLYWLKGVGVVPTKSGDIWGHDRIYCGQKISDTGAYILYSMAEWIIHINIKPGF